MATMHVYDPKKVTLTFGAAGAISGYADGTFISVEYNEDFFTLQIGSDGQGVRSTANNLSARITLTLMQSSASNEALSAILNQDLLDNKGFFSLQVKDTLGSTLLSTEKAYIVKFPTVEFARESSNREWVFETHELAATVKGSLVA